MFFSLAKIRELMDVINFYHVLFIGQNVGKDVLTKKDIKLLKSRGIDISKLPKKTIADYAYHFGMLAQALGDERTKNLSFSELIKFIESKNFIPLTSAEKLAISFVKQQMYSDIKGLGNKIAKDFSQITIEVDQKKRLRYEDIIKNEAVKALEYRKSTSELSSELGHKTKDWARDFDRISDYIMHNAFQQGIASQLLKDYGEDCNVFFSVYPGACKHCISTYLTGEIGSEPKQFKLKVVIANGSNIGRKVADWLPSISPLHPWCRCTLHLVPENGIWSQEKQQFIIGRNTYGVNRKSKVKVNLSR